jgi:deoxyxylulose-5-phosphate synthase
MGVPDEIVTHGDPKKLLAGYGLDAAGIVAAVTAALAAAGSSAGDRRLRAVR